MLYTVDRPDGFRITRTFGLVEATTSVEISDRGNWARLFEEPSTNTQVALNRLAEAGPDEANAIVGVRLSTTAVVDGKGAILLLMTYYGTPVLLESVAVPASVEQPIAARSPERRVQAVA